MAFENLCLYCFKDMNGASVCPHCGKDARAAVPQIQMLPGTTVYRDRFLVGRALGQDSGGIVYTALDTKRGGTIRIREYLPRNCAERLNDGAVVPIPGMEDAFDAGMRKLRASVDSVEDPRKRHFYFEENGTAYIAQRKNTGSAPAPAYMDDDDDDERRSPVVLYIAIAAAVVLAVAIGVIWFLNSMGDTSDVTLNNPLTTTSAPEATWMPEVTPTPTPYATATFAALVDPELSWMDYTYSGDVNQDYQSQVQASATKAPTVDTNQDYGTVNNNSSSATVRALQEKLTQLGWMEPGDISGKYDSATRQAVKDFQRYVNEHCSPARKLSVDGIAGEKTQQWLYNSSVSLVKPTPTPTPLVTPRPGSSAVVDSKSDASEIKDVQRKLIALGLLPSGSADGRFGSSTATAVKNFQIRVNQILEYEALEVNGVVNADTMAYLNYYVDWWQAQQQATATPAIPQATATPRPTQAPDGSVSPSSSKTEIAAMQEKLSRVGVMKAGGVDGVYGNGTVNAVKTFQNWINQLRGEETLVVSGQCDALTMAYLDYCIENGRVYSAPTPVPTEAPTATPSPEPTQEVYEPGDGQGETGGSGTIDPSSPEESISYVQEMLSEIGLLPDGSADGNYGSMTKEAIRNLQQYVNDMQGYEVLRVTGICDPATLEYLIYAYDRGFNLGDQGDVPEEEPDAEIIQPEITEKPTPEPDDGSIRPDSDPEKIAHMQDMLAGVGLMDYDQVDGDYGGRTANAIMELQLFINEFKGEAVLPVNGECDALTLQYLQYCYDEGWNLADKGDASEPEDEPEDDGNVRAPVGEIGYFYTAVAGRETGDAIVELSPGGFTVSWEAEGEVDSYSIWLYDGNGNLINSAEGSSQTSLKMNTSGMNPGEIYEMQIGVLPVNGIAEQDMIIKSFRLMLPEQATPEPTEAPTPTPEPTEEPTPRPSVSKPTINIGSSVYQSEGVTYIIDDTIIFSWMADGDVESYTVTLMYEDGTEYSLGTTQNTSKTVSAQQLAPGLYKLFVGATPIGGGEEDTLYSEILFGIPAPEITEAPTPEPTEEPQAPETEEDARILYIDAFSSAEDIKKMQLALYGYGLLNDDEIQVGVLDAGTLQAVADFQMRVNEAYGANLAVIDPAMGENVYIDEITLDYLIYQMLDI